MVHERGFHAYFIKMNFGRMWDVVHALGTGKYLAKASLERELCRARSSHDVSTSVQFQFSSEIRSVHCGRLLLPK